MRQPHDSAAKVKPGEGPEGFGVGVCPPAARVQFAEVTAQNASHQQNLDAVVGPCFFVALCRRADNFLSSLASAGGP